MNTTVSPHGISSSYTKPANSNVSGTGRLIIGAITVLFVAMVLAQVVWTQPAADISAISAAQTSPRILYNLPGTEYFPAQYQNQGKEIPEHIQAF